MEKWRLFIAMDLAEPIKAELGRAQHILRKAALPLTYVRPEAMHLTLSFLGQVATDRIGAIVECMQHAARPCDMLMLTHIGAFPTLQRPSVIWVGLGGATNDLTMIHTKLRSKRAEHGFPIEQHPFAPHLTLARVLRDTNNQERTRIGKVIQNVQIAPLSWQVSHITLYRSELLPSGPRYAMISNVEC